MIQDKHRHTSLVDSVCKKDHKKEHQQECQNNQRRSNHSNSTASLFQEQQTFFKCWQNINDNQFFESKKYLDAEKQYHKTGIQKIVQNSINSLRSLSSSNSNEKKKQQPQQTLISYVVFNAWIPYVKQKFKTLIYFNNQQWIVRLQSNFDDLITIIIRIIQKYYTMGEMDIRYNYFGPLFMQLSHQITSSKKWVPINDIILKIVSRLDIPLRKNPNISPQILNLTNEIDDTISKTQIILRSLYINVELKNKKLRLKELMKIIQSFPVLKMQVAIQYSVLKLPYRGVEQIILYTLQFMKYQLDNDEKKDIQAIIETIKRLRSRDLTGFLPKKDYENQVNQKSWRFFYKNNRAFNFFSPVRVDHQEFSWQTLISYNKIIPGIQIPISVNVDENFICLGLIICENLDLQIKQYAPQSIISYSPFSGKVSQFDKIITNHQRLKYPLITKIIMKIQKEKIIWEISRAHEDKKKIVQTKFEYDPKQTYRFIMKFKRGRIWMFDTNLLNAQK